MAPLVPLTNDYIVDINSRLNGINVGTSVILSRFDVFSTPIGAHLRKSSLPSVLPNETTKITLTGSCMQAAQTASDFSAAPKKHIRRLSISSTYRLQGDISRGPLQHPKPPIDRRAKKPERLKRTNSDDILSYRERDYLKGITEGDGNIISTAESGASPCRSIASVGEVSVVGDTSAATCTNDQHSRTYWGDSSGSLEGKSVIERLVDEYEEIDEDSHKVYRDASSEPIKKRPHPDRSRLPTQRELRAIHSVVSEVMAETVQPVLNLDLVDIHEILSKISYEICRPVSNLDATFSDRLWRALFVTAGFCESKPDRIIKVYKVNIDTDWTDSPTDTVNGVRPADLVLRECYIIITERRKHRYYTFWEFRKYLPPAKPMGDAHITRENPWQPTDCTFEIDTCPDEDSVEDGDCLSDEN